MIKLRFIPRDKKHDDFLITPALACGKVTDKNLNAIFVGIKFGYWAVALCYIWRNLCN